MAKKYFGDEDPMNKILKANNQFNLKVTGVYKAFPSNSHMHPAIHGFIQHIEGFCRIMEKKTCAPIGEIIPFSLIYCCRKIIDPTKWKPDFPLFWIDICIRIPMEVKPSAGTALGSSKINRYPSPFPSGL